MSDWKVDNSQRLVPKSTKGSETEYDTTDLERDIDEYSSDNEETASPSANKQRVEVFDAVNEQLALLYNKVAKTISAIDVNGSNYEILFGEGTVARRIFDLSIYKIKQLEHVDDMSNKEAISLIKTIGNIASTFVENSISRPKFKELLKLFTDSLEKIFRKTEDDSMYKSAKKQKPVRKRTKPKIRKTHHKHVSESEFCSCGKKH